MQIPMRMVGLAIGQSFFPQAARAHQEGALDALVRSVFKRLVLLSLFPLLILTICGSDLFSVVFGSEWREAGFYLQLLAPWVFFWFISYPLGTLYSVLEKQEISLRMNFLAFSTRLVSLIIGGLTGNPIITFLIFSASGVLSYGFYSLSVTAAAGMPSREFWRLIWQYGRWFLPVGALLGAAVLLRVSPWVVTALSVFSLAGYGYFALRSDASLRRMAVKLPVVGSWLKIFLRSPTDQPD
jgi:O-antigen/teichoic acid export membrane protein